MQEHAGEHRRATLQLTNAFAAPTVLVVKLVANGDAQLLLPRNRLCEQVQALVLLCGSCACGGVERV